MLATVTSVTSKPSKFGGEAFLITFKGEDGKSYRTWVATNNGNFQRWSDIIFKWGKGVVLAGLVIKGGNLIDADSQFYIS